MATAGTQRVNEVGPARIDHAHDAVGLGPIAGRHCVIRHVVHVNAGVTQITGERVHEVADLAHQRVARELRRALLPCQLGRAWGICAITHGQFDH
ncbi:hypothetical protein D3C71_1276200 [compost metagenome]